MVRKRIYFCDIILLFFGQLKYQHIVKYNGLYLLFSVIRYYFVQNGQHHHHLPNAFMRWITHRRAFHNSFVHASRQIKIASVKKCNMVWMHVLIFLHYFLFVNVYIETNYIMAISVCILHHVPKVLRELIIIWLVCFQKDELMKSQ